ncbi:hypothetical protein APS56_04975 [Pseudalgibacter alginicilyticus]|uniref:Uncharacterized protein n=1 Tax=Pseudalgibacter alginicilyticus TaxID=1736674 RepID=A0A0P0CEH7_9FLAO|nr:hypothetical protein APS56_04975 [Pseudalgibacter alginicilyticus]
MSCENEKIIQLPEITHSDITEIHDVSPAYLFYDKTQIDSIELNRKNLIVTTHWLVNVDKRLTLKQAIPHIKFLQDKKANSSHKNESAKNYFTCNDLSRKNLGFIEFTNVIYETEGREIEAENNYNVVVINLNDIKISTLNSSYYKTDITNFANSLRKTISKNEENGRISLSFNNKLSFQNYITFKSILLQLDLENNTISNNEFIFN